ncbi:MAG: ribonuclease HI [Clostridiales bacterium]|nr:ribonuclease HI [Clostridiales bacterium]
MKKVTIYTDGGCRGNGKTNNIGGYGIVLIYGSFHKEIKKGFSDTTNNIMELLSIIDALKMLKESCRVDLYSDSAYVINAINNKWIDKWSRNNWVKSSKEKVKNIPLWQELIKLLDVHEVYFHKVKGHADNQYNNRCDELANMAMDEVSSTIKKSDGK